MTASEQLAQFAAGSKALPKLCREYKKERATVHLKELVGGALSFYAAAAVAKTGGVHIFVAEDRDAAAYLLNDFYNLLDEKQVYFFPSSYKRSAAYGAEDAQGVVQRTAAMNAVRGFTKGYLVVCTYPEALAERVVDAATLQRDTIAVKLGDKISIAVLEDALADANFTRVDFVYEPGQYSVRGGIVDVFSYSESKPYRIDFSATRSTRSAVSIFRASFRPTSSTGWRSSLTSMPARHPGCRSCSSRALRRPAGSTMPTMCCAVSTTCAARCSRTWRIPGRSTAC